MNISRFSKIIGIVGALSILAVGTASAAATTYTLKSVEWRFGIIPGSVFIVDNGLPPGYTNHLVGTCDGCGIATATNDGAGNITLANGSLPVYGDAGGNGLFTVCNSTTAGDCPVLSTGGSKVAFTFGGNGTTTLTPGGKAGWSATDSTALVWNQAYCIDSIGANCGTGATGDQFGGPNAPGGAINWTNGVQGNGTAHHIDQTQPTTTPGFEPWNLGNGGQSGTRPNVVRNDMCCGLAVWEDADGLHVTRQVALASAFLPNVFQSYTLNYAVVPVPGAVWLFGSAIGLLGWARRRAA
ncbi:MAG: hypothetical protein R3F24_12290 [Gammaproteobacteria bacterium]